MSSVVTRKVNHASSLALSSDPLWITTQKEEVRKVRKTMATRTDTTRQPWLRIKVSAISQVMMRHKIILAGMQTLCVNFGNRGTKDVPENYLFRPHLWVVCSLLQPLKSYCLSSYWCWCFKRMGRIFWFSIAPACLGRWMDPVNACFLAQGTVC